MICLLMEQKTCTFPLFPLTHFILKSKMPQNKKTPNVKHKSRKSSAKKVSPATVAKKSRTKTRKPKYLSLKLQLSTKTQKPITHKQQLNLFPQKDQHHMQEHDQVNDDVAFLLDTDNSTTNLHDLLDTRTVTSVEDEKAAEATKTVSYYGSGDGLLEKAAMRSKERDASEERWVSFYEVVEEVSSCSGGTTAVVEVEERKKLMGLKLDYEEIMNAWCDKGPLYVDGECPQTVPDFHASSNALGEEWGSVGNLWQVPEIGSGTSMEAKKGWKLGEREASVLRYKEKRQNRLFSKRIRYQVRKLNAEKRPRLKGRFVKRDTDE